MPEGGGNFWWEREIPSLYRLIAEIDTQLSKMGGKQRSNATGIQSVLLERLQKALAAEQAHYSLMGLAGTDPTIDKRLAELESPSNESPLAESPRAIKPLLLPTDTYAALGLEIKDLFAEPRLASRPEPVIVRQMKKHIASLRSTLAPSDRERDITVVLASRDNPIAAFARALALSVEGEIVQVAFKDEK